MQIFIERFWVMVNLSKKLIVHADAFSKSAVKALKIVVERLRLTKEM